MSIWVKTSEAVAFKNRPLQESKQRTCLQKPPQNGRNHAESSSICRFSLLWETTRTGASQESLHRNYGM